MKIDTMRNVDYYAGIIICFFLTLFDRTFKIFYFEENDNKIKNILLIQLAEMGSMVLSYSSIKKIKDIYPDAKIYFLTFSQNRYCIDILNMIDEEKILTIRANSFFALASDTLKVLLKLRRANLDVCLDFEFFSRFSMIISYLSNARKRVGFSNYYTEGLYRGDLLTHKVHYNTHQHMVFNFLALIHSIGYPEKADYLLKKKIPEKEIIIPKIKIAERDKKRIWDKLRQFNNGIDSKKNLIVVNPYAGELLPIRSWPLSYYIILIKELLKNKNNFVIITGGKDTIDSQNRILKELQDIRIIPLAGKTTFNELIDLYNISKILITNDSGPAHFASLTPIKTFAFYGPGGLTYKPLDKEAKVFYSDFSCSPCLTDFNHGKTSCRNNKCLKAVKPEEVYKEVSEYLKK